MIVCKHCSRENPENLVRCLDCGRILRATPGRLWGWLLAAALTVGVTAAGGLIWKRSDDARQRAAGLALANDQYVTFRTSGLSEFHGLNVSFEYPASFASAPLSDSGGREFKYGDGRDRIIVTAVDTRGTLSAAELLAMARSPNAQQAFAPGSRNWNVQAGGLAFPSVVLDYDFKGPIWPLPGAQCRDYTIMIDHWMVHILFMRIAPSSSRALDEWSELMQHVVQSVKKA